MKLFAEAGFPADTADQEHPSGSEDVVLFARCVLEERILVTLDLDFANIRAYPPGSQAGIVVLRSKSQGKRTLLGHLNRSWQSLLRGLRQINCGLSSGTE